MIVTRSASLSSAVHFRHLTNDMAVPGLQQT
jgi:hypothetical protein